jgi:heat shock protein HspQ
VHGGTHTTYVAERNLEADASDDPIEHPLIEHVFSRFENGRYIREQQ